VSATSSSEPMAAAFAITSNKINLLVCNYILFLIRVLAPPVDTSQSAVGSSLDLPKYFNYLHPLIVSADYSSPLIVTVDLFAAPCYC
jgi:hypothetical protein